MRRTFGVLAVILGLSFTLQAAVPNEVNFQGYLTDDAGTPINGVTTMTFSLFDQVTGGLVVWNETIDVTVADGNLSVILGQVNPIDAAILSGGDLWLEIGISAETLIPRYRLVSAAYAVVAENAEALGSIVEGDITALQTDVAANTTDIATNATAIATKAAAVHTHSGADITSGNIGTAYYSAFADLNAESAIGTGAGQVAAGNHNHDSTYVNENQANSITSSMIVDSTITTLDIAADTIVAADIATDAVGAAEIAANAVGSSEISNGSVTASDLQDGATLAEILDDDGPGSGLNADLLDGSHASSFATSSHSHFGAMWIGSSSTDPGLYVSNTYAIGTGIRASGYTGVDVTSTHCAVDATGDDIGVWARSSEVAVRAEGNIYGVLGIANTDASTAVYGSNSYSGNYGYLGSPSYAGRFQGLVRIIGDLDVSGAVSKGSGSFKIDHPLDPANKYLSHSFVESPDMMNIYNGNVVTDGNGDATVELPEYFEALNGDFRYQLTVIGQFAQAIVKHKLTDNTFTIKTDKPNVEVSWQITGIRKDPYAVAHPIQVEEDKPSDEQELYLHPTEYGLPETMGIGYGKDL